MAIIHSQAPGTADDTAFIQAELNSLNSRDEFRIDRPVNVSSLNWPLQHGTALTGFGGGMISKIPGSAGHLINLPEGLRDFAVGKMEFDGARSSYPIPGTPRSIFFGQQIIDPVFESVSASNVIDAVFKLRQSTGVNVRYGKHKNIGQNVVELRNYPKNPVTGLPWAISMRTARHRITDVDFTEIDSGEEGAGDSCAITMDSTAWWTGNIETATDLLRAQAIEDVLVSGCMTEDVMRFFFSENYGHELDGLAILGWIGRNRVGAAATKNGIGLLGVHNATIGLSVGRNIGSMDLNAGNNDNSTGVFLGCPWSGSRNRNIIVNGVVLVDDGDVPNATDHQINARDGDTIQVINSITKGSTEGNLVIGPTATNIATSGVEGASAEHSWRDTFEVEYYIESLPASMNGVALRPDGWNSDANTANTSRNTLVAASYRLSAPILGQPNVGTITIAPFVDGSVVSSMGVSRPDFTGQYASKKVSLGSGVPVADLSGMAVRVSTDAAFSCAGGLFVKLVFDRSRKQ